MAGKKEALTGMKTEETKRYILESYLLTGNDFADYQVAVRRMKTGRGELLLFRLCGMALIFLSLLGRVFFTNDTTYDSAVYFLLLCLGVGICLYYDYCMPYVVRRRAFRYFASYKGRMLANHVEFDGRGIRFVTDIGREEIPYEKLRRAYEDKRVILLEEEQGIRFLPKRVLTMDEYEEVRKFLKRALKEKYVQEGVC